jgi:hypothetical protein
MRLRIWLGALAVVTVVLYSVQIAMAQNDSRTNDLAGTWVYRLGQKTLFIIHLEHDKNTADRLHGLFLHPKLFNMNSSGGSVIRFSNITNESKIEPVISIASQDGLLHLKVDAPSNKPEDLDVFLVRDVDSTHIDFTLFQPLPPLRMERATDPQRLADDWDTARTYSPDDFVPDDPQMVQIVAADQADRKDGFHIDWQKVDKADEERRIATAALLKEGKLHTGHDFESAALVFQHGAASDDYLLAHVLAVVAISKGQSGAVWISSATLDRYLQSIHQPQVFGTQFATPTNERATQEPYARGLISDSLRVYLGVPTQAEQEAQRHRYDAERGLTPPIQK